MSFIVANIGYDLPPVWNRFIVAPDEKLNVNYLSNNDFQLCQLHSTTFLLEKAAPDWYDCNIITTEYISNVNSICNEKIRRIMVFTEENIELVACSVDVLWVLGLDHRSQSLYLSNNFTANQRMNEEALSEVYFYTNPSISIFLDSELFFSPEQWHYLNDSKTKQTSIHERRLHICDVFRMSLVNSEFPFVIVSDNPWTPFDSSSDGTSLPWSLSYWMDFCGLTPTTVYTWEILPLNSIDGTDDNYNNDGICSVKYVNNGQYIEGSKRKSVACLSDVMDEEYQVLMPNGQAYKEVNFISSMGLTWINQGNDMTSAAYSRLSSIYFKETISVIRAYGILYQNAPKNTTSLHVRSLFSSHASKRVRNPLYTQQSVTELREKRCQCDDCSIQNTLMDLLLIHRDDEDSKTVWVDLVKKLNCLTNFGDETLRQTIEREIELSLHSLFVDEGQDKVRNYCSDGTALWCQGDTQKELANVFANSATLEVFMSHQVLERPRFSSWKVNKSDAIVKPEVLVLKDGLVYVLIFVLPRDLIDADVIVQQLQAGAFANDSSRTAHILLKYLIIPLSIEDNSSSPEVIRLPSMRSVLMQSGQFITDLLNVKDIVVVLNGIDALRSLLQPASDIGMVPNCFHHGSCYYHLDAPVMVACINNKQEIGSYNFNAFVGVGRSVLTMLTEIRRHPLYPFSSDNTIRGILREYAWKHQLEVVLDRDNKIFASLGSEYFSLEVASNGELVSTSLPLERLPSAIMQPLFKSYFLNGDGGSARRLIKYVTPFLKSKLIGIETVKDALKDWAEVYLMNQKWFAGAFYLIILVETAKLTPYFPLIIADFSTRFVQISRNAVYWSHLITHVEYRDTAELLQFYLKFINHNGQHCRNGATVCRDIMGNEKPCECAPEYLTSMASLEISLSTALAALHQATGSYDDMIKAFRASLNPEKYSAVRQRRQKWKEQRAVLQQKYAGGKVVSDEVKIHFVTYATDISRLVTLRLSAGLSLITLEVVNWRTPFSDYSEKIEGYYHFLQKSSISDDDIVVLVDAYDVLLLPRARQIGSVLAQSEAPIMFCAEAGIYPDFAGAFFYHRGSVNSHHNEYTHQDHMTQKFLNSGIIAGRAGQLRHMFAFAHRVGSIFRDDQQVLVYYMLQNPDMIAVDTGHQISLTTFKMSSIIQDGADWDLSATLNVSYTSRKIEGALQNRDSASSIGIIHCNNKGNNNFYSIYANKLREYGQHCYSGEDGPYLIRAVNAIHDKQFHLAKEYLSVAVVVRNRTSFGGVNPLGDTLMSLIE